LSTRRGLTWSYQPPQSSYASRNAELRQSGLSTSALTSERTNACPDCRFDGGCSLGPDGAMY